MRIEGLLSSGQLNISGVSDLFSRLDVGDIIKVQIQSITLSEILLAFPDGSTVYAASMSPLDAKIGDYADFLVSSKKDNQVFLESIKPGNCSEITDSLRITDRIQVKSLHASMDAQPYENSIGLEKNMLFGNVPVTRDNFTKLTTLLKQFPSLTPGKALFMQSNGLEIQEKNINLLSRLILSNYNSFIQIPLNVWGQHTTGELYVLKNPSKGKKKLDPKNMSVFLSLDMRNLGLVEVLLNMADRSISMVVRLENEETIEFLKNNSMTSTYTLYNMLSEKGYKLVDLKFKQIDERINPLNASDHVHKSLKSKDYSFDMRV